MITSYAIAFGRCQSYYKDQRNAVPTSAGVRLETPSLPNMLNGENSVMLHNAAVVKDIILARCEPLNLSQSSCITQSCYVQILEPRCIAAANLLCPSYCRRSSGGCWLSDSLPDIAWMQTATNKVSNILRWRCEEWCSS